MAFGPDNQGLARTFAVSVEIRVKSDLATARSLEGHLGGTGWKVFWS
jgi:hypothetical protein